MFSMLPNQVEINIQDDQEHRIVDVDVVIEGTEAIEEEEVQQDLFKEDIK